MKSRTTIILVVLALIIGGFVYWDYKKGVTTEQAEQKAKKFLDMKTADVMRLELVSSNQTIVVEKTKEHWDIKQPLAVRGDDNAVNSIFDALEFAERQRTFTEAELAGNALADFGLKSPRVRLTFRDKKGDRTVLFGSETPTKDLVYAQVQGEKNACLVTKNVFDRANATLDSLRNRVVMDFASSAATRIEIKVADRLLELARSAPSTNAEPRWAIVKPFQSRADQQKVGDFLSNVTGLRVNDFVSEDAKDARTYQLDDPRSELTVWTGDKGQTLLIGRSPTNDVSKLYVKLKSADSIYTVAADSAKKFELQVNDLRDTRLLTFNEADVRRIEVAGGADKVTLTQTGRFWNVDGPAPVAAEETVVHDLLRRLSEMTSTQFVADVAADLGKYGLAKPGMSVTLWGEGTNVVASLLAGTTDTKTDTRYLKRGDEPFIYGVPSSATAWIPTTRLDYRSRRVAELKVDDLTKLTVEKPGGRLILQRGADKKWRMIEPAQGVLNVERLQHVLDVIGFLRAEEIVRENLESSAAYGLDKPSHRFSVEAGAKTVVLQLGKAKDALATFASWSDPALVFTLGSAIVTTLTNSLVTVPAATNVAPVKAPSPSK